jgi:hypothetical protein
MLWEHPHPYNILIFITSALDGLIFYDQLLQPLARYGAST